MDWTQWTILVERDTEQLSVAQHRVLPKGRNNASEKVLANYPRSKGSGSIDIIKWVARLYCLSIIFTKIYLYVHEYMSTRSHISTYWPSMVSPVHLQKNEHRTLNHSTILHRVWGLRGLIWILRNLENAVYLSTLTGTPLCYPLPYRRKGPSFLFLICTIIGNNSNPVTHGINNILRSSSKGSSETQARVREVKSVFACSALLRPQVLNSMYVPPEQ